MLVAARNAEFAAMAAGPFCEAGRTRARLPASSSADDGYLVANGANKVEEKVIKEDGGPRPDDQYGDEKLKAAPLVGS